MAMMWFAIATLVAPFVIFAINLLWGIWQDTRPNKMRAIFLTASGDLQKARIDLQGDGKSFRILHPGMKTKKKYHVIDGPIYRDGMFRVPTSFYRMGQMEPLDLEGMKAASGSKTADEFEEATESHVAKDIIEAFHDPFITPTTTMIIVIGVVIVGFTLVYWGLNSQLEIIIDGLGLNVERVPDGNQ